MTTKILVNIFFIYVALAIERLVKEYHKLDETLIDSMQFYRLGIRRVKRNKLKYSYIKNLFYGSEICYVEGNQRL